MGASESSAADGALPRGIMLDELYFKALFCQAYIENINGIRARVEGLRHLREDVNLAPNQGNLFAGMNRGLRQRLLSALLVYGPAIIPDTYREHYVRHMVPWDLTPAQAIWLRWACRSAVGPEGFAIFVRPTDAACPGLYYQFARTDVIARLVARAAGYSASDLAREVRVQVPDRGTMVPIRAFRALEEAIIRLEESPPDAWVDVMCCAIPENLWSMPREDALSWAARALVTMRLSDVRRQHIWDKRGSGVSYTYSRRARMRQSSPSL